MSVELVLGVLSVGVAFALGWLLHWRGETARRRELEAMTRETVRAAGQAKSRADDQRREVERRYRRLRREHTGCAERILALETETVEESATRAPEVPATPESRRPAGLLSAPDETPDDLTAIRGIGPTLERELNQLGIFHYGQLAHLDEDEVEWLAAQLHAFPHRVRRDAWIAQARRLARGELPRPAALGGASRIDPGLRSRFRIAPDPDSH